MTSDSNYNDKKGDNARIILKDTVKPPTGFFGRTRKNWIRPPLDYKVIKHDFVHAKIYVIDGRVAVVG
jgi:phosphatidylserine/phosphatidylglycerophosphate/cardiolipin synthase-like enzyme